MAEESRNLNTAEFARAGEDDVRMPDREALINRAEPESPSRDQPASTAVPVRPAPVANPGVAHHGDDVHPALLEGDETEHFKTEWSEIQAVFVDAPRAAVERADKLVATVMKRTAEVFAKERATLEQQWDKGETVTTEDLRLALQRYRAFFDRLLSV